MRGRRIRRFLGVFKPDPIPFPILQLLARVLDIFMTFPTNNTSSVTVKNLAARKLIKTVSTFVAGMVGTSLLGRQCQGLT